MHDGRFETLEEVMNHYSEHIKKSESVSPFLVESLKLTPKEKSDLISFLNMLTDNDFVTNPEFSDPELP